MYLQKTSATLWIALSTLISIGNVTAEPLEVNAPCSGEPLHLLSSLINTSRGSISKESEDVPDLPVGLPLKELDLISSLISASRGSISKESEDVPDLPVGLPLMETPYISFVKGSERPLGPLPEPDITEAMDTYDCIMSGHIGC